MLIIIGVVSVALVVLISFFAVSGNSGAAVRRTARIALAAIVLSVGVCLFVIFSGQAVLAGPAAGPVADEPVVAAAQDLTAVVAFAVIFVLIVALVLVLSFLDRRKRNAAQLNLPRW
jgi:cytochrome bd-type quinol oxidase subunit 2